ncbi:MAG: aminotransferase class I/II-fold pyridoxal phosphate-dependent enzyme [Phycisphaerales bacterium JB037]
MTAPPATANRFKPFGTTIFAEMTALANEHGAVNLSQGFPDFDGPGFVKDAAARAIHDGINQYSPMPGRPELRHAIARFWADRTGDEINPDTEVTVTPGCTGALASTFLGLFNPGDEVVMFEPFYDSYRACAAMAGVTPRFVTLRPGEGKHARRFVFDSAELEAAFTPRTRAILVNTPHNPTGKVFSADELDRIATLCRRHDAIAITDEVYDQLVYEPDLPHIRLATLPGMRDRTISLNSLGKTFSLTGWKIGWAIAPPHLTAAVRAAHQFLVYAVPGPLQIGAAAALSQSDDYIADLVATYRARRDQLSAALSELGFQVFRPEGTYFIMADHTSLRFATDVDLCRHLATEIGVAAIPPSAFYSDPARGKALVRFAFCKTQATIDEAIRRLSRFREHAPGASDR